MLFGVSTASLYPMYTEEALLYLAEQNIKNVEIFINSNAELHGGIFKRMLDIIKSYKLNVLSFHPLPILDNLFLFSDYDRRKQEFMQVYELYFKKMNELGAKILVIHGARADNKYSDKIYFERYNELYELGIKYNITVAQENVFYCKSGNLDFLSAMSRELGNNAKFVLDLKQAVRAGCTAFDIMDRVGEKIIHIHASDNGKKGDCLPIGKGEFDFKLFLSRLKEIGFNKGFLIELYRENFKEPDELKESVSILENVNNLIF